MSNDREANCEETIVAARKPRGRSMQAQEVQDALRHAGLRATASRMAVLRLLATAPKPLSHAEVAVALESEPWNRATLYRNLIDLVRSGLAFKTALGDRVWRFGDARLLHAMGDHPHFVCVLCGEVQCLPDVRVHLDQTGRGPRALESADVDIQLRGRCDQCR